MKRMLILCLCAALLLGAAAAEQEAAVWTVTFHANDGSESPATAAQTIPRGESAALDPNPFSRWGYRFTGWNTASGSIGQIGIGTIGGSVVGGDAYADGQVIAPDSDLHLYAQWTAATPELEQPDLILPPDLRLIGEEAFAGTPARVIVIPDGKDGLTIEARAFADCPRLAQVRIPANCASIDPAAFEGCPDDLTVFGQRDSAAQAFAEAAAARGEKIHFVESEEG